jgi:TOBE domain
MRAPDRKAPCSLARKPHTIRAARRPGEQPESVASAVAVVPDSAGPGEVTDRSFLGSAVMLDVTLGGGQKVLVELPSHDACVALGDRASLRILVDSVVVEVAAQQEPQLA